MNYIINFLGCEPKKKKTFLLTIRCKQKGEEKRGKLQGVFLEVTEHRAGIKTQYDLWIAESGRN